MSEENFRTCLRTVKEVIEDLRKNPNDALCYIDPKRPPYGEVSRDIMILVVREDGITEFRPVKTQKRD